MPATLKKRISKKSLIFYKVIPFIVVIIDANVFLMGFLLSGVLSDYKESEKMPGELAAIVAAITDEIEIMCKSKKSPHPIEAFGYMLELTRSIVQWFHKGVRTSVIQDKINGLNDHFVKFESLTQANFITRLKQEQSNLRKLIIRIHTIRETGFISSGYFIAGTTTVLLLLGLIFSKIEPFYESLFFVGVVSYLLIFLIFWIRDLDNPFGFYEGGSSEDVSLKPVEDMIANLSDRIHAVEKMRKPIASD